jgi:hypothetical protein
MSIMYCSLLSLGCAFGFTPPNAQSGLTALRALKIAQRRLRPEVRSKLLSVASAPTNGDFTPTAWRFVFSDPGTSGHCRVVTVAAKASSEHPDTIEAFSSSKMENVADLNTIPQNKLAVDSDRVLGLARQASKLKGAKRAEFRLLQSRAGREPLWHVLFSGENGAVMEEFTVGAKNGALEASEDEAVRKAA